jgi:hypothetical protein
MVSPRSRETISASQMSGFAIRAATTADSQRIARLVTELGYATSIAQMRQRLDAILGDKDYETLVAVEGAEILGFVGTRIGPLYEADGYYGHAFYECLGYSFTGRGYKRAVHTPA